MVKKSVKKVSSEETKKYNKDYFGVSALTLAISGFFVTLFNPFASLVLFIVALVFSIIQQKNKPNKIGNSSLIISIVGIVLDIAFIIILITIVAEALANIPLA